MRSGGELSILVPIDKPRFDTSWAVSGHRAKPAKPTIPNFTDSVTFDEVVNRTFGSRLRQ